MLFVDSVLFEVAALCNDSVSSSYTSDNCAGYVHSNE